MESSNDKTGGIGDKINDFVQKNRKQIFITLGVLVVLLAGTIVFFVIKDSMDKKAIAEVHELTEKFDQLRLNGESDYFSSEMNSLLTETLEFAGKNRGFSGSKAWSIAGYIYSARENWTQAEEAWASSARTGSKTYLAPIAYFQAAVCAEAQNKLEQAIDYFQQSISHSFEFPDAPRAQFNIGRLYEELGNNSAALAAYRAVLINWPWERSETISQSLYIWQNLARNQIIKLEIQ